MLQLQKPKMLMKKGNAHEEFASKFCNFDGLSRYIISKPCKIAIYIMSYVSYDIYISSIESLPDIILHQSFGVSPKWMVIWF